MHHFTIPNSFRFRFGVLLRVLVIAASSLVLTPSSSLALDISTGAGILDEGDDHSRTAAILRIGTDSNWTMQNYLWGRSYGPVTETSGIVSVGKKGSIFGSKSLVATVGFSLMAENSTISYKGYPEENASYTSTNAGLLLGLNYEIFSSKLVNVSFSWDSHLFAASEAIILLVTGRKQIVGLTAGVAF